MGRQLVAYYSRRGQNLVGGELRDLAVGNTEIAAEMVRVLTQADIFRIEPVREYAPDYCRCIDQARQDLIHGVRLELKAWPEDWEGYDTVYLGYPNHWSTLPVAVFSFVEGLDWTGKTIRPFCTSSSSGLGKSGELLAEMAGTGDWQTGMRFTSRAAEADVAEWVNSLGA